MKEVHFFLDYDGSCGEICVDGSTWGPTNLWDANNLLNDYLKYLQEHPDVSKITLHCFSLRQDPTTDKFNADRNKNGSAFKHFQEYAEKLKHKRFTKVELDQMLVHDLAVNEAPGWTWTSSVHGHNTQDSKFNAKTTWCDESKILKLFTHAWHAHRKRDPEAEIIIKVVDDRLDIIRALHDFYAVNPDLLPPNTRLQFVQYAHSIDEYGSDSTYFMHEFDDMEIQPHHNHPQDPAFDLYKTGRNILNRTTLHKNMAIPPYPKGLTIEQVNERVILEQEEPDLTCCQQMCNFFWNGLPNLIETAKYPYQRLRS